MLGRVLDLEPSDQAGRLLGAKRLVEGRKPVDVQVVHHNGNVPVKWIMGLSGGGVGKVLENPGEALPRPAVGDLDTAQVTKGA